MSSPSERDPLIQNQSLSSPSKRYGIYTSSKLRHGRAVVPATHEHQRWLVWFGEKAFWAQDVFMGGRDNGPAMTNLDEIRTEGTRAPVISFLVSWIPGHQIPGHQILAKIPVRLKSDSCSAAIHGELRAIDETRAVCREEHDRFSDLIGRR